jgi:phosphoribosylformimino-5-aminoimidazole carboxamide ribotide isomerase
VQLYPALDLRGGRLARAGDARDPVALLQAWRHEGAAWVHVVDLDRVAGAGHNAALVARLVREGGPGGVQLGGGLTGDDVTRALDAGVTRVITGGGGVTGLPALLARHGAARVGLALDLRDGMAWTTGGTPAGDPGALLARAAEAGVHTVVVRDLARDGTLAGARFDHLSRLRRPGVELVLAGGVASLDDVGAARAAGVAGVIVGRALLDGRFTLAEALACCG